MPVISVEKLSKAYRIGVKDEVPDTLVGAARSLARAPLANLRRLQRLDTTGSDGDAEDTLWALRDVSFEIQEGEVVGVIGRNGAGKSTLLKILSRITEPTSGRAIIRGRVSSLLEVGTGFHPELTGRENIYMNGTILGMRKKEIDRKFDQIVDFSGVEKFLDTPVKRYSSGMSVRLAFAVAAHLEPEILIIDEVLAVGDAEFQKKCLGKMQDVASSGRTVLFVSHNLAAVEALCHSAVLLEYGQLVHQGQSRTTIRRYLNSTGCTSTASVLCNDHPNRRSGMRSVIKQISLRNSEGLPCFEIPCGAGLTIELDADLPDEYSKTNFDIVCEDSLGASLFVIGTQFSSCGAVNQEGRIRLVCQVPSVPLAPDTYFLTVRAKPLSSKSIDVLDRVVSFTVVSADFFGNGVQPVSHRGRILLRSNWRVLDCASPV
jgi:lipopolysaccharide transport system ATP-binding protein